MLHMSFKLSIISMMVSPIDVVGVFVVVVVGVVVACVVVVGAIVAGVGVFGVAVGVVVGAIVAGVVVVVIVVSVDVSTDTFFMKHTDELLSKTYGLTLVDTVTRVQNPSRPYSIFFSNKIVPQPEVIKQ